MKKLGSLIKKKKKLFIALLIVIVLVGAGVIVASVINNAKTALEGIQDTQTAEKIEKRDILNSVTATGTIVASQTRSVSSTLTGVDVKELKVAVGDKVAAGDVLCILDSEQFQQQLSDAQKNRSATVGRTGIDVDSSNRGLTDALTTQSIDNQRAEEDKKSAYNQLDSTANRCQEAKDAYDDASNALKSAKNKMDGAKNSLDAAKAAGVAAVSLTEYEDAIKAAAEAYNDTAFSIATYVANNGGSVSFETFSDTTDLNAIMTNSSCVQANAGKIAIDMYDTTVDAAVREETDARLAGLKVKGDAFEAAVANYASASSAGENAKAASVASAEAMYAQAKADYEMAKAKEESQKSVYESCISAVESQVDAYNRTLRSIEDIKRNDNMSVAGRADGVKNSNISAGVATLADDRNIQMIEDQIDGCNITATIGGMITKVDVIEGDRYVGGSIVTIEDTSKYEVLAMIDEYDISKIKVGQEVIVRTNGTGELELKGEVKSISPHATVDMSNSGVRYEVMVSILENNEDIRLDMTAKIEIICDKREGVLAVPTEVIQEDEDGNAYIEIYDKNKSVDMSMASDDADGADEKSSGTKVYITRGIVGDYYTQIIGENLQEGMKVIVPEDNSYSDLEEYMINIGLTGGY